MAIQGIIRPPPDIRVVADRTAMFVAKNGRAFESRILGSAKGKTPKFAFLQPTSPFHAYYEDRIKHFESGGDDEKKKEEDETKKDDGSDEDKKVAAKATASNSISKAPAKDNVTKQKASVMDPVSKAIMNQRSVITNHLKKEKEKRQKAAEAASSEESAVDGNAGEGENGPQQESQNDVDGDEKMLPLPAPPVPLDTVQVVAPYHMTPTQIETIQLVAQFVAMDGKGGPFLQALISREWSNPDFGFCQPRNVHFSYFLALVDAYRKIISDFVAAADSPTINADVGKSVGAAVPSQESKSISIANSDGRTQVPTKSPLPIYDVQAALNDAAYRTEYERELERRRQKHQENSSAAIEDGEIANAIDWHDFVVVETIDFPIEEQVDVGLSMLPTKTANTTATTTTKTASNAINLGTEGGAVAEANDMDMEESSDEEDDEADNIRVVPSYTPKVVGTYDPSTARAVDPITGKSVSVADMPEHMRIQLLDPKWAEERKKFQDKQKDSNLVGGDAVVANIARMTQTGATANGTSAALGASTITTGGAGSSKQAASVVEAPLVTTAPIVGPAEGMADPRRLGQQQQQHNGFRGPHASVSEIAGTEQPPPKRQRTNAELPPPLMQQQQNYKVTIAPPLVEHQLPVNANDGLAMDSPTKLASMDSNPPTTDDDPAKAPVEKKLLSADEFIATLGEKPEVELQIRLPNDGTNQNWNFFGQTVTLNGIDPKSTVRQIKDVLSKQHLNSMPVNKIQLKSSTSTDTKGKFLNNNTTLAALNIGPTAVLELKSKQRGGRK